MFQKWEEIEIPVPWGHISGKWWGSKDVQPILAIHGHEHNAGSFDTLAPLLVDEDISILSIDLPGHGFSSRLPSGLCYYQVWDGVIWLRRIADYFKWKQISIMGHSLGGAIGFLYAAIFPNEVYKYISLDTAAPLTIKQPLDRMIDKFIKCESKKSPSLSYHDISEMVEDAHKNNLTQKSCEILMKRGTTMLPDGSYVINRDNRLKYSYIICFSQEQIHELALKIKCQVLNIRANPGQHFDNDAYESVLKCVKQNAAVFEYHRVPGNHHVHLNNPERVADLIKQFLKS